MLEAEIKIAVDDSTVARLRQRLEAAGADERPAVEQCDVYYAHPNRDFARSDEALRLRQDAYGLRLTYKGPKLDPPRKTREEIEFPLETDLETADALLHRLGFRPVARVRKTRTEFALAGPPRAVVCLDVVAELGTFCEIEVEAKDVAGSRAALDRLAQELDLHRRPPIAESYLELLLRSDAPAGAALTTTGDGARSPAGRSGST